MTRKAPFRQSDLTRAIRGVVDAGLPVSEVRIDDNKIVILTSVSNTSAASSRIESDAAELDRALKLNMK
jgi:hypothetical protein